MGKKSANTELNEEKRVPASEYKEQGKLVFGLDIGTRSIVGTVGFREGDSFIVLAQESQEHTTRAMLDGQIHDINAVSNTITDVKKKLEEKLSIKLTDVCIAAAGRVLKTEVVSVTREYEQDKTISIEDVAELTAMGVEKAYEKFLSEDNGGIKFYCVGNSVIRYYLNGYQIGNLENHKASSTGCDMIATFLPDDVVDGLYKSVELAGLRVVNMTLEPIAAISVAIPENYRMLNIGLVDVGAGTSDICITKDGCIEAYGMIPMAGDAFTEMIASAYLVDFNTAEKIKIGISENDTVEYNDIMGLPQKVSRESVLELLEAKIDEEASLVAERFRELNGGKSVSAVFVVGGGGKIEGYTKKLSEHLGIVAERVAVRGEEVMGHIVYKEDVHKDSMLVTPVGICLNYYEQSSSFIYVSFNDERIKLYDSGNLGIVDAAMHADFPNDGLFPKRGKALNYRINGKAAMKRGTPGDPAVITLNGEPADMHTPIRSNDVIRVEESTAGEEAHLTIGELPEFKQVINVTVNGSRILLPRFAEVNGEIKNAYYEIEEDDDIVMRDYYTVKEVREFMDVKTKDDEAVMVNNEKADEDTKVYENFSIKWGLKEESASSEEINDNEDTDNENSEPDHESLPDEDDADDESESTGSRLTESDNKTEEVNKLVRSIIVNVNGNDIKLEGKSSYVYVDVFDHIEFDLKTPKGTRLITDLNGRPAQYMEPISSGDSIEIRWEN